MIKDPGSRAPARVAPGRLRLPPAIPERAVWKHPFRPHNARPDLLEGS
jgi:hypothetical protein